jgi:large subunit ribosomal protein L3
MRAIKGILGTKLGMTQVFDDTHAIPVTVIKAGPCVVAQVKSIEGDGYEAVQLAFGDVRESKVTKPMKGHYDKFDVEEPRRHLVELRTDDAASYTAGQELRADVFAVGDKVDVVGVSKGKGFSGVMRRHGFHGLRAEPRRAEEAPFAGFDRRLCHAQPRLQGDADGGPARQQSRDGAEPRDRPGRPRAQRALVKGAVPGPNGGLVMVRSAVKSPVGSGA